MSTLFIAVQCFKCSTMQVKQQKKSSNKWTCVICNEKQSVRKIHARGHQAKDVRRFVQGFNSSRSSAGGRSDDSGWISPRSHRFDGGSAVEGAEGRGERRRTDWSECLDSDEREEEEEEGGAGLFSVPVGTTELPSRKLGQYFPNCPSKFANGNRNLKPDLSTKRKNESIQGSSRSVKFQRAGMRGAASKWSKYLDDEEDEIGLEFDGDEIGILEGKESMVNGLIVEEEVHPDFI